MVDLASYLNKFRVLLFRKAWISMATGVICPCDEARNRVHLLTR